MLAGASSAARTRQPACARLPRASSGSLWRTRRCGRCSPWSAESAGRAERAPLAAHPDVCRAPLHRGHQRPTLWCSAAPRRARGGTADLRVRRQSGRGPPVWPCGVRTHAARRHRRSRQRSAPARSGRPPGHCARTLLSGRRSLWSWCGRVPACEADDGLRFPLVHGHLARRHDSAALAAGSGVPQPHGPRRRAASLGSVSHLALIGRRRIHPKSPAREPTVSAHPRAERRLAFRREPTTR